MLSQERRSQLDGIVLQMSKQNAPQEDVQAIVNDFKGKYENETPITETPHAPNNIVSPEWEKKSAGEKFQAGPTEIVKGFAKGVLNTIDNASQIGYDVLKKGVADPLVEKITGIKGPEQQNYQIPKQYTEATNNFQSVGKGIEQLGEFFIPAGFTAKLAKIGDAGLMMTKLATEYGPNGARAAKALSFLTRSGLLAGEGAGVTKIQTYGDEDSDEQTKMNAIISGALPITGKVLTGVVKPVLKVAGEKIENALIKPSVKDVKDGFKIENVAKYDVGGSLEQISQKTHNKIEELGHQLNQVIQGSDSKINLPTLIDKLEADMTKNGTRTFGMNTKLAGALKFFRDEIGAVTEDGNVSIADAQQIKRSVGKLGAWQYGARDPESTAIETVANNLYTKLKNEIEKVSPNEIRDINRQMSELIPIENAVIRRIPIADRNNIISLTDVLTAAPGLVHPSNLWLFFLNRLSKSGVVGNALMKAGQKAEEGKGAFNELLFGPNKNTVLTPGEQNVAGKVSTVIDGMKSKGGMSVEDVSGGMPGYDYKKLSLDDKEELSYLEHSKKHANEFNGKIKGLEKALNNYSEKSNKTLYRGLYDEEVNALNKGKTSFGKYLSFSEDINHSKGFSNKKTLLEIKNAEGFNLNKYTKNTFEKLKKSDIEEYNAMDGDYMINSSDKEKEWILRPNFKITGKRKENGFTIYTVENNASEKIPTIISPKKNDEKHLFDGLVTNIQKSNKGVKINELNPVDFSSFKDTVKTKEGRKTVDHIKEQILNGEKPSIVVKSGKDGKTFVEDGHHTVQAYKELGFDNVPVSKMKGMASIGTLIGGAAGLAGASTLVSKAKNSMDGKVFEQPVKEKDTYVTEQRIPPQETKKQETILSNNIKENKNIIEETAREEGFKDVNLLLRMAEAESSFNRFAKNSYKEKGKKYNVHGIFQISDIHGLSQEEREDVKKATKWAIDKIRKGGIDAWKSSESKWKK